MTYRSIVPTSALIVVFSIPSTSHGATDQDFENAERTMNLVMKACLSSTKLAYKVKGEIDLSILKKIALGGQVGGDGQFEKTDIVSYLPELKDELQQAERDAIRECINPLLPEILEENNLLKAGKKDEGILPLRNRGFYPYGGIKIAAQPNGRAFSATGSSRGYPGFTKVGSFDIGNRRTMGVRVMNSGNSDFHNMDKMLKVIVGKEDLGLICNEEEYLTDDPEFIYKGDGKRTYQIPEEAVKDGVLRKVGFVFGPGNIKDIQIEAWFE